MILSEIEQRIKAKIEAIGTPLKEWNVNIYRGILTGYNDAFIIDKAKKEEILAKCQSEEERKKTDELIRPILRGRDIKRYGYEFADLYIITTFPSLKIDIELYPAVKQHLLSFGYDRLKQTGEKGARKKTNNKWFETQDSIGYWEDFFKQKIAWASVGETYYSLIPEGTFLLDTNYFFSTEDSWFLGFLNSKLITYWINSEDTPIGNGGAYRHYKYNLEKLPIIEIDDLIKISIMELVKSKEYNKIDQLLYKLYNLSEEEIIFIESI